MATIKDIMILQDLAEKDNKIKDIQAMQGIMNNNEDTIEGKYLEPYVYPFIKTASQVADVAATPLQWMAGPIGEGLNRASNYLQDKPQEPLINPIMHPYDYAKKYGTSGSLMRTLPVGNEPFDKIVPASPLREKFQQEFPIAAEVASKITPNDIASGIADFGLAKSLPTPEIGLKANAPMSLETAADYVRSMAKNNSQLMELEKSGKLYDLASMVQKDPEAYLHQFRPNKIYENLMGDIIPEQSRRDWGSGKIKQTMDVQNQFIEDMPRNTYVAPLDEMRLAVHEKLGTHGGNLLESQKSSAAKLIDTEIAPLQPSAEKVARIKAVQEAQTRLNDVNQEFNNISTSGTQFKTSKDLLKLMDEKKSLEKIIKENYDPTTPEVGSYYDMINERNDMPAGYTSTLRQKGNRLMAPPEVGENPFDVEARSLVGRAMEQVGSEQQAKVMESSTAPQIENLKYLDRNKDVSNMLAMRDLMQGNFTAGEDRFYVPQSLSGTTGLLGAAARMNKRFIKPTLSPVVNSAINAGKTFINQAPEINQVAQKANAMMNSFISKPIAEQLSDWEIPRSADQILANKKLVLAKIAQVSNDPMTVNMLNDAFDKHPEKLGSILPVLIANPMFHNLFKANKYQSWVDGKILDPIEQQKAYRDVDNKSGITNTEKIMLQNGLNRDGTFPEDF